MFQLNTTVIPVYFQPYAQTGLNPYDIRKDCAEQVVVITQKWITWMNTESRLCERSCWCSNIDIFTSCDDTPCLETLF